MAHVLTLHGVGFSKDGKGRSNKKWSSEASSAFDGVLLFGVYLFIAALRFVEALYSCLSDIPIYLYFCSPGCSVTVGFRATLMAQSRRRGLY